MSNEENLQTDFRRKANLILDRLSPSEQKELLIKCWMSHDAGWFMAVAAEYGVQATNRRNQIAAHEIGKVEARRIFHALQPPPVKTIDDYLLFQEVFISLLGPNLMDYHLRKVSDHAYQVQVQCCFASENALRAGIADEYECGISLASQVGSMHWVLIMRRLHL